MFSCGQKVSISERPVEPVDQEITVIYPKPEQVIGASDSTFILGHVPPNDSRYALFDFTINGQGVAVHPDGGFLAFLPITPGDFVFKLRATRFEKTDPPRSVGMPIDTLELDLPVTIPEPLETIELPDAFVIVGDYHRPFGDLVLATGDRLNISFMGTSGCRAWASIDGVADSIPVAETEPRTQAYWGESVFGAGGVPDSLKLGGIYTGFYDVPDSVRADSVRITYHLAPPTMEKMFERFFWDMLPFSPAKPSLFQYVTDTDTIRAEDRSAYKIWFNDPAFPMTVRFTDSVQILRHGPRRGYFTIFQPEGVEAEAVGQEGDWYKLRMSQTQYAWANRNSVEVRPKGILPAKSLLRSIRTYSEPDKVLVEFPLAGKHPFRVIEESARRIKLQLFGVTSDTDWIRYDFSDSLVKLVTWFQPEPGLYEFTLDLSGDLWGYDTYYRGNMFYLQLNRPPSNPHTLQGKTIVLDPGHSADPGSIGPTGMTEAEANLNLALKLRDYLLKKGANVVMTRDDTAHVALYDRPSIAKAANADLFISIHNNALPDGVNPYANNGTSSYYYHPHSINLAKAIHPHLVRATGLADHGLFHGNLAVNRPTQYPAVLLECAFMIIPEQEAMLKTDKFRKRIAKAITAGIDDFLKGYDDGRTK